MAENGLKASMFLRSLCIQASWNFERLQNLGFAFLIYPALERKYGRDSEELADSLQQHLDFFNTHPYFAGMVAGAVAREEGGDMDRGRFLQELKRSMMGVLGSIGDGFFWATLKPLSTLIALLPALFGSWWAPLVLLVVFNVPHLAIRWWGVGTGLSRGCRALDSLSSLSLSRAVPPLSLAVAGAAGLCAGVASLNPRWAIVPGQGTLSLLAAAAVFISAMLLSVTGVSRRFSARLAAIFRKAESL